LASSSAILATVNSYVAELVEQIHLSQVPWYAEYPFSQQRTATLYYSLLHECVQHQVFTSHAYIHIQVDRYM